VAAGGCAPPRAFSPKYANGKGRVQQGLGRRDQPSDPHEGCGEGSVVGGDGVQPGQVGAEEADLDGPVTGDVGEREVATG
jgi:hypothetical protein